MNGTIFDGFSVKVRQFLFYVAEIHWFVTQKFRTSIVIIIYAIDIMI